MPGETARAAMPLPELTPKQGFAVPPCSQHPPACPRGKPSPANHAMALLCSLQLLAIPDICVYSTTHNRVVFPGRAPSLPFSCCLPCVHLYIYIFFFSNKGLDAAIFSTLPMCWRQFMLRDTWQRLQKYFLLVLGEASLAKEHYSASKTPFPVHSPAHEADAVLKVCFSHDTIQKPYGDPESRTRSSYPLQYDF